MPDGGRQIPRASPWIQHAPFGARSPRSCNPCWALTQRWGWLEQSLLCPLGLPPGPRTHPATRTQQADLLGLGLFCGCDSGMGDLTVAICAARVVWRFWRPEMEAESSKLLWPQAAFCQKGRSNREVAPWKAVVTL